MKVAYNNSLRRLMIFPWRNSASEMFAHLSIPSCDELLFLDFGPGLLIQTTCLYLAFIILLVVFIYVNSVG